MGGTNHFDRLPDDLIRSITFKLNDDSQAYRSFRECSQRFRTIANCEELLEIVDLTELYGRQLKEGGEKMLQKCVAARNKQALHMEGMRLYYHKKHYTKGLRMIWEAMEKGNVHAKYSWGVILHAKGRREATEALWQLVSDTNSMGQMDEMRATHLKLSGNKLPELGPNFRLACAVPLGAYDLDVCRGFLVDVEFFTLMRP